MAHFKRIKEWFCLSQFTTIQSFSRIRSNRANRNGSDFQLFMTYAASTRSLDGPTSWTGKSFFQLRCVHMRQVNKREQHRCQKEVVWHFVAQRIQWLQPEIPCYRLNMSQNLICNIWLWKTFLTINHIYTVVHQVSASYDFNSAS